MQPPDVGSVMQAVIVEREEVEEVTTDGRELGEL